MSTAGTLSLNNSVTASPSLTVTGLRVSGLPAILDISSGMLTTPGLLVQQGQVIVEGNGILVTTGGDFNTGQADQTKISILVKNSGTINGAGRNWNIGNGYASVSNYVKLQDAAQATFSTVSLLNWGGYSDSHGAASVMEIKDSAQLTATGNLYVLNNSNDQGRTQTHYVFAQLYQHGGTVNVGGSLRLADADYGTSGPHEVAGSYNLSGGILKIAGQILGSATFAGSGQAFFNFHGGTLAYTGTTDQSNFIDMGANSPSNLRIWEGATIDTGTKNLTVNQALLAGSGNGISSIATTGLTTQVYDNNDPPWVYITGGGGSGATAVATLDAAGHVNGIVVTNPGNNYTSTPTIQLTRANDAIQTVASGNIVLSPNSAYTGGLTKIGAGTLTLTAANTYKGTTVVNAGTLLVNNTTGSGTGTGSVLVSSILGGTGVIGGAVTVNGGGTLAPGANGIGTLTINNALSLSGNTIMEINKSGTTLTSDRVIEGLALNYGGTLTVTKLAGALAAGDTFTLFSAGSYTGNFTAFSLPDLGTGLKWDTSNLKVNGTIRVSNTPAPSILVPATAVLSADNKTASLSAFGSDIGGEANLTYTWSATGPAGVTYSVNGTNAAKNSTATFSKSGSYVLTVTMRNAQAYTTTSTVNVTVNQNLTSISVSPGSVNLPRNGTQQFTATALDQFGDTLTSQPSFTWSTTVGTITSSGLLTAPAFDASGSATATSGSTSGASVININDAIRVWDGGGSDNKWSTAKNWVGDVAPSAGVNLVFPSGAAQSVNINDYSSSIVFGSITISGGSHKLNLNNAATGNINVLNGAALQVDSLHSGVVTVGNGCGFILGTPYTPTPAPAEQQTLISAPVYASITADSSVSMITSEETVTAAVADASGITTTNESGVEASPQAISETSLSSSLLIGQAGQKQKEPSISKPRWDTRNIHAFDAVLAEEVKFFAPAVDSAHSWLHDSAKKSGPELPGHDETPSIAPTNSQNSFVSQKTRKMASRSLSIYADDSLDDLIAHARVQKPLVKPSANLAALNLALAALDQ